MKLCDIFVCMKIKDINALKIMESKEKGKGKRKIHDTNFRTYYRAKMRENKYIY